MWLFTLQLTMAFSATLTTSTSVSLHYLYLYFSWFSLLIVQRRLEVSLAVKLIVPPGYLSHHNKQRWGEGPSVPGSSSHLGAAAVEGNMCGVCGEAGEDAVRLAVGKRVDLHRVAGAGRHQPLILRRRKQEEFRCCQWQVWSLVACRWGPTLRAREWTFSPTVMNLGSSSSRPSHIRTSPSLPLVTMYLRSSQSNHRTALPQSLVVSKRVIFNTISPILIFQD